MSFETMLQLAAAIMLGMYGEMWLRTLTYWVIGRMQAKKLEARRAEMEKKLFEKLAFSDFSKEQETKTLEEMDVPKGLPS